MEHFYFFLGFLDHVWFQEKCEEKQYRGKIEEKQSEEKKNRVIVDKLFLYMIYFKLFFL